MSFTFSMGLGTQGVRQRRLRVLYALTNPAEAGNLIRFYLPRGVYRGEPETHLEREMECTTILKGQNTGCKLATPLSVTGQ